MSIDGFRQGDAPASIFFNILAARIYRRQLATLNGRGVPFAIADDVKIAAPPTVITEIVETFAKVAWNEADLITQVIKKISNVQPSARAGWTQFLDTTPTDPSAALSIHDIPDGSFLTDPSDPDNARQWHEADEVNVLGTPLDSPDYIESYFFGKEIMHRQLFSSI